MAIIDRFLPKSRVGTTLFYLAFLHLKRAVKRKSSTHVGKMGSTHASLHIRIWHARYGPATTGKTTSSCFECFVDPVHVERSLWCSIRNPPISAHLKVEKLLIPDAVSVCVGSENRPPLNLMAYRFIWPFWWYTEPIFKYIQQIVGYILYLFHYILRFSSSFSHIFTKSESESSMFNSLVVSTPPKNMKVSWDDYSQYIM